MAAALLASKTAFVYSFGNGSTVPFSDKNLLGGKGAGLVEMSSIGLPVPPGFIITTEACNFYRKNKREAPDGLKQEIDRALKELEKQTKAVFGGHENPLLVSVRSGARVSMPGMMDTILNLGLNDETVAGFAKASKNERLAYDCYRRFIMMYSDIVSHVDRKHFEAAFDVLKMQDSASSDIDISVNGLKEACRIFKEIHRQHAKKPFPQDVREQLKNAVFAVFDSWESERAVLYRQLNHIPDSWGTAVTVQTMCFGNKNEKSSTGVCFTRDPASGANAFYGEFLPMAQGEEVVAGIRTPHPINNYQKKLTESSLESLEEMMPSVYLELYNLVKKLEAHYKDMQDIEFTIDDGKLYLLQTRSGKRTGFAAVAIAADMLTTGLIDEKTALRRVQPDQLIQLLAPIFDAKAKSQAKAKLAAHGLNAGPGAASGRCALSTAKAVEMKRDGIPCILVREEANPDDFPGLVAAEGVLTLRGGATSHAAVVARGMGKPCVVGCGSLTINEHQKTLASQHQVIKEGDPISIDGLTGEVFFCELPTSPSEIAQVLVSQTKNPEESILYRQYETLMALADKYRKLKVRANADTPLDSAIAKSFGAEGVGLCRTEHMFLDAARLNDVRAMFFSTKEEERKKAIERLLPHQKQDFIGIFKAMQGLPAAIRLLDPPLHEFMPHSEDELNSLANMMHVPREKLAEIAASLDEQNPMLGHRGCRLGITYPELTAMQTKAILEAAIEVLEEGIDVAPEIMIPLVSIESELIHQKSVIDQTAAEVFKEKKKKIPYLVGTMIELPRAALLADKIAAYAEFFSFGTNDLTQTTFGISRDDGGKFIPSYVKGVPHPLASEETLRILQDDPFQVIDRDGVGKLMEMAVINGKKVRANLKCGICGEHGGEPSSIAFCQKLGLDYVSCSPYRVPIARLAAALAAIND